MSLGGERAPLPRWVVGLAVVLLTLLAYANAAPPVLLYDDEVVVLQNPRLELARLPEILAEPARSGLGGNQRLYRPLAMATLALDRSLWRGDLRGFHRTSIVLHATTTAVLFGLLLALGAGPAGAAGAALVFGIHPIHTEAVDVAYNRSEVLATLGVLSGLWWLWSWWPRRRGVALAGAATFYLLALLCRESAVTFPALALALLVVLPRDGDRATARELPGLLALLVPLAAYLGLRQWALGETAGGVLRSFGEQGILGAQAPWHRLALVAATLRDYWRLLLWPHPLQASYEEYTLRAVPLALLVNAALVGLAFWARRRHPTLTLGITVFYVALLPSTRLFADPAVMAERFLYLPSAGMAIPLASAFDGLRRRWGMAAVAVAAAAAVATLLPLTWQRNRDWHSRESLWQAEVQASADDWKALLNLSQVRLDAGRYEEAIALCERGQGLAPRQSPLYTNQALALLGLDRRDAAEAAFRRAVELSGGAAEHLDLARFYVMTGRTGPAEETYGRALDAEGDPARDHAIRGERLLYCRSDLAGARAAFGAALVLAPHLRMAHQGLRVIESRSAGR
jgi:tetratricopeptide (TPR) repeat protein